MKKKIILKNIHQKLNHNHKRKVKKMKYLIDITVVYHVVKLNQKKILRKKIMASII